ncbi:MAG: transglutaminaseTgpA domain-containing protein [Aggregatilineales bacterium]
MATANVRQPNRRNVTVVDKLINFLRTYFSPGDFTTLFIVMVLLLMPALSLSAAEWPVNMRVIVPVLISSAILGLVLARSQFNELLALIVSTTYGICFIVLTAAIGEPGNIGEGVYQVFLRSVTWFLDATSGGINTDDLIFTLLVATLFWFLGYNASWHVFRIDRVWRVVLPPGLILVTNNVFYDGDANLSIYLAIFMFTALLLIARSNLDAREWEWYVNGIRPPTRLRRQFLMVGAVLSLSTLLLAWNAPSGDLQDRLDNFKEFLDSEPLREISEFWNRLFSPVDAAGPTTADYYGGDSLDLGGAIQLGDQTVLQVEVLPDRRYYWRSRVFDTYESGSWSPAADTRLTDNQAPLDVTLENYAAREIVPQRFTIELSGSRLVYTAPQPLQVNLTTRTDLRYTAPEGDPARAMNISVIRPTQVLRRGDDYTALSSMSIATAFDLRAASVNYPAWLNPTYFYVSPSVSERTRDLARQIIIESGAVNPYDQAKAIESWLRANITYNESIPQPPRGQDPVDWVLFDYREGYCNYYASAMIVMLRSLGIPARMAAGFAQGTWDAEENAFIVTERDAHTWVEAYFPGYGWIEFEPTSAQAQLNRDGDQDITPQDPVEPDQQQQPSPTPTVTPTLPPTSTPEATNTPLPPDQQNDNPPPTATITPTFTPSPTATPVIVPTQPPPIPPEPQGPLAFILPALGLAFMGLLLLGIVAAIIVFIWWWWEWRGMRGLSPISRAYARLERYIPLVGIRFDEKQTPEERRKKVVSGLPQIERPVTAITRLYATERYGRVNRRPEDAVRKTDIADEAWSNTRTNILRRWLRRFIPFRKD